MRCLVKYWRSFGIKLSCFLDDGLGTATSLDVATQEATLVRNTLLAAGFLINEEKSVWSPTRTITWLGVQFCSDVGMLQISQDRTVSLQEFLDKVIHALPYSTPRTLARLCGKIISTKYVLGNVVQLKTRRLLYGYS